MGNAFLTFSANRQCFVSSLPGGTVVVNPPNWGGGILGGSCGMPTCCRLSGGGYDILERAARRQKWRISRLLGCWWRRDKVSPKGWKTLVWLKRRLVEPNRPVCLATEQRLASQLLATTLMALADANPLASVVTHRSTHLPSKRWAIRAAFISNVSYSKLKLLVMRTEQLR